MQLRDIPVKWNVVQAIGIAAVNGFIVGPAGRDDPLLLGFVQPVVQPLESVNGFIDPAHSTLYFFGEPFHCVRAEVQQRVLGRRQDLAQLPGCFLPVSLRIIRFHNVFIDLEPGVCSVRQTLFRHGLHDQIGPLRIVGAFLQGQIEIVLRSFAVSQLLIELFCRIVLRLCGVILRPLGVGQFCQFIVAELREFHVVLQHQAEGLSLLGAPVQHVSKGAGYLTGLDGFVDGFRQAVNGNGITVCSPGSDGSICDLHQVLLAQADSLQVCHGGGCRLIISQHGIQPPIGLLRLLSGIPGLLAGHIQSAHDLPVFLGSVHDLKDGVLDRRQTTDGRRANDAALCEVL